jgi:peptide/nickel transport system substrate-binding protein
VDNYTFKATLPSPDAEALYEFGDSQCAIVPREVVEQLGDLSNAGVGAGPYILEEYVSGERERLVRNPDYFYADRVYLDAIERIVILDGSTLLQAYLNDQIDINGWLLTKLDYEGLPDDRVNYTIPSLGYASLAVNASEAPYDNPMVRKALWKGVDRRQFIDKIGFGDGLPMGPISRAQEFWTLSEEELAPYLDVDYEGSKAMLEAAGVEEGFQMIIDTSGSLQIYTDYAQIVVSELTKIGINAELALSELGDYLSNKLFAGNFNATVFTHNPYETPKIPLGFYHSNGIGNGSWWHYDNAEISAMIDAQQQELDADTRLQMVRDTQIAILEDGGPLINMISPVAYGSYHPRLGGYDPFLRGYQGRRHSEFIKPDA